MDANEALADLTQISVQISNALIQDADGSVLGSTLGDEASQRLARLAGELWEAANRTRSDLGRDELAHLEVATPEGSVFLVHDAGRSIVATTSSDPTVGLVFYDLKACLRSIAPSDGEPAAAAPAPPAAVEPEPQPLPEPESEPELEVEAPAESPPPPPEASDPQTPRPFSASSPVFHRAEDEPPAEDAASEDAETDQPGGEGRGEA
jgi:predicted regulator of Ras-like GTPase activity (Roadblock/LC7/MglB family)